MKAVLLMLGALSAAIIFVGCGTAVGRATGVETSEVEQVIDEKQLAIDIQRTCGYEMNKARRPGGLLYRSPGENLNKWMEDCIERLKAEALAGIGIATEVERAVEEAEQELEVVKAGAEEVLAERDIQQACSHEFQVAISPGGKLYPSTRDFRVVEEYMSECMPRMELELASESGTDVEKAAEAVEQEMEIVRAGAEEVLAERELIEAAQIRCQQDFYDPSKRRGKPRTIFINDCMREAASNNFSSDDIDSDIERVVEEAEQEMEIVKAGAEQVVEEKAMVEDLQNKCLSEFNSAKNRYGIGGTPRLNIDQFMTECMNEGSKDLAVLGDIDVDVEKAVEEAKQEVEIVRAGAEAVLAERELMESAQTRCYADSLVPRKRRGIPLDAFMAQCISKAASTSGVTGDIDFYINKAVEAAQQEMAVAKAEADRAEEEREVIRTATRLCQRDSLDASKRKGKPRNDFINDCIRESAANRDASGEIDSDIEKEVETAEQELDIVKAGAEEVFEERVASLEEKVAELTELLEALQTQ